MEFIKVEAMQCISYPLHVHRIPSTLDFDASKSNRTATVESKSVSPTPLQPSVQPVWQSSQTPEPQRENTEVERQGTERDTTDHHPESAGEHRALPIKTAVSNVATLDTLTSQVEQLRTLVLVLMLISGVTMLLVIRAALSATTARKRRS